MPNQRGESPFVKGLKNYRRFPNNSIMAHISAMFVQLDPQKYEPYAVIGISNPSGAANVSKLKIMSARNLNGQTSYLGG